jgi:hypothetical protein
MRTNKAMGTGVGGVASRDGSPARRRRLRDERRRPTQPGDFPAGGGTSVPPLLCGRPLR